MIARHDRPGVRARRPGRATRARRRCRTRRSATLGLDCVYVAFRVPAEQLDAAVHGLAALGAQRRQRHASPQGGGGAPVRQPVGRGGGGRGREHAGVQERADPRPSHRRARDARRAARRGSRPGGPSGARSRRRRIGARRGRVAARSRGGARARARPAGRGGAGARRARSRRSDGSRRSTSCPRARSGSS